MTFHILINQITTLFLSLNLLTTLTFDSEIVSYLYGGKKDDVFFQVANNRRTLVLKAKLKDQMSNLLVITKDRKYYFELAHDEANPHQFIEVKDGVMNHALKESAKTEDYQILEGESSLLFINKKNVPIQVNGIKTEQRTYLSKGVPIIVDGKRILN
jgi:hypothetical protein